MQLQQLRYIIAIAESGSMNSVARTLFISQSSLSVAVKDLEQELGIKIFNRSSKGISLTSEGVEFLGYARQVVEQADLLKQHYSASAGDEQRKLSISSQHYAFAVRAFIDFVSERDDATCDYSLHETRTSEILDDVASFRSDIGILYLSTYNEHILKRHLEDRSLEFVSLFKARPHVFVRDTHPLALKERVTVADLRGYPRYTFEQGSSSSLYFSEEPLSTLPHPRQITVSDRATMTSLLTSYDGFLISTGVRSDEMYEHIVSFPLDTDEVMNVGYVVHSERRLGPLALAYLDKLRNVITSFDEPEIPINPKCVTQARRA